jgi:hypothetical protein
MGFNTRNSKFTEVLEAVRAVEFKAVLACWMRAPLFNMGLVLGVELLLLIHILFHGWVSPSIAWRVDHHRNKSCGKEICNARLISSEILGLFGREDRDKLVQSKLRLGLTRWLRGSLVGLEDVYHFFDQIASKATAPNCAEENVAALCAHLVKER